MEEGGDSERDSLHMVSSDRKLQLKAVLIMNQTLMIGSSGSRFRWQFKDTIRREFGS